MPLNDNAISARPIQGRPLQQDPMQQLIQFFSQALQGGGMAIGDGMSQLFPLSPTMQAGQDQRFNQNIAGMDQQIQANGMQNERLRQILSQPLATAPNPQTYQLPQQPTPAAPVGMAQLLPKPQPTGPSYLDSLFLPPQRPQQAQTQPRPPMGGPPPNPRMLQQR